MTWNKCLKILSTPPPPRDQCLYAQKCTITIFYDSDESQVEQKPIFLSGTVMSYIVYIRSWNLYFRWWLSSQISNKLVIILLLSNVPKSLFMHLLIWKAWMWMETLKIWPSPTFSCFNVTCMPVKNCQKKIMVISP